MKKSCPNSGQLFLSSSLKIMDAVTYKKVLTRSLSENREPTVDLGNEALASYVSGETKASLPSIPILS